VIKLVVFASGNGSNALNLAGYFKQHPLISFTTIYCNNPNAGIISKAKENGLGCRVFTKEEWKDGTIQSELDFLKTDFIVLAGFLWLVPESLVESYNNRIINIHPSLLPKYGGKGMYGMAVHNAVVIAGESESGITIHLVNKEYDKGAILSQKSVPITKDDTPESVAHKIHDLEYAYFPKTVEDYILNSEYTKIKIGA
jgi:phosphoribosylglycinamide formyltransferase-1